MQFNPFFEIIFAAVIWGTTGVFVKFLDLPSASITFFRLFIPAIITLLILCYKRTDFVKKTNKIMVFISIVTAFRMLLYFFAFKNTSIGNAVIILYTWPVFAVLLSPIFLKEKLTGKILALSFFAFIGIITIFMNKEFSFTNNDFLGMFSMLLSAVLTALMFVVLKKQLIHYSTIETVFYQNILGVFIFLPFLFVNKPVPSISQISIASVYGFFGGLVGYLFYLAGLRKVQASIAALLSYIEVLTAVFLGILIFNEVLTVNMIIGGIIILAVSYFARKIS